MQLGMARKCWGRGQRDKREKHENVVKQVGNMMQAAMGDFNAKSYDEEVLGEVGSVMWEEDTENEDMVKQVGDSCIAVQYVCGAVENSMQLGTTRG